MNCLRRAACSCPGFLLLQKASRKGNIFWCKLASASPLASVGSRMQGGHGKGTGGICEVGLHQPVLLNWSPAQQDLGPATGSLCDLGHVTLCPSPLRDGDSPFSHCRFALEGLWGRDSLSCWVHAALGIIGCVHLCRAAISSKRTRGIHPRSERHPHRALLGALNKCTLQSARADRLEMPRSSLGCLVPPCR